MRDEGLYLDDIVVAGEHILQFLTGVSKDEFLESELIKSAVLQKLTVIGEASSRLSSATTSHYPSINWRSIKGFRNIAVHAYFEVDWDIVWKTVTTRVDPLVLEIRTIIRRDFPSDESSSRGK